MLSNLEERRQYECGLAKKRRAITTLCEKENLFLHFQKIEESIFFAK